MPLSVHALASATDRFSVTVVPSAVQPVSSDTYTIAILNRPNSDEAAQSAQIDVPAGFIVDPSTLGAATTAAGACSAATWTPTLGPSSIDLAAPADAASELCPGGTLTVTFSATAPAAEDTYTWTTTVARGATQFSLTGAQPVVTVDGTPPPDPTINSAPTDPSKEASPSFGFSSSGASSYQCQLDGGGFSGCSSPTSYSGLADGLHTFDVKASDAAGNESGITSYSWTIDTVAPPAPSIDSYPPNPSASNNAGFTFSESEGGTTLSCQLDGGAFTDCSSHSASYSGLADGSHTFEVKAVDAAGNASSDSYTWTIDTTPPPPPLLTSAPQNPSGSDSASFSFTDAETVAFLCQLDGHDFFPCTSPQPYSNLDDGSHTFDVKAVDAIGHESEIASYTWTIDTIHPLVTLTDKPPLLTNQTTASFTFSSNKPGSTYECKLDGGGFGSCKSPQLYTGLDDGSHTFFVRATSLGNLGLTTEYTWTVDTVAPDTAITSSPPASSNSAAASFTFTSSEVGSTFSCGLDAGGMTPCASPKTYAGLGDGTHTFRVQAVDAAGNVDTSPAAFSWQIAGVGPGTADTTPPGNVKRLKRKVGYRVLKLTWTRPSDSDFDHVKVFVSTSAKSPPRTLVYKGKARGYMNKRFKNGLYYRYAVLSYDHAGNASRGAAVLVPPSILLRSPRNGAVVKSPPRLLWALVPKATFYNVQLYSTTAKLLSAWPEKAKLTLSRRWTYAGRRFELKKGLYRWFVWPGFGPRAKGRYGQLLGQGNFRVS